MRKELIDRINELAHKKKEEGLTEEEKLEQAELRAEYLAEFRKNFKSQLENVRFVEDLTEEEIQEIAEEKAAKIAAAVKEKAAAEETAAAEAKNNLN